SSLTSSPLYTLSTLKVSSILLKSTLLKDTSLSPQFRSILSSLLSSPLYPPSLFLFRSLRESSAVPLAIYGILYLFLQTMVASLSNKQSLFQESGLLFFIFSLHMMKYKSFFAVAFLLLLIAPLATACSPLATQAQPQSTAAVRSSFQAALSPVPTVPQYLCGA